MKRKQIKKLASEIAGCELIRSKESSSKEEITRAEHRILQITNLVLCLPDGINVMSEIDTEVQRLLTENN